MVALNEDIGVGEFFPRDPPFRFVAGTPVRTIHGLRPIEGWVGPIKGSPRS